MPTIRQKRPRPTKRLKTSRSEPGATKRVCLRLCVRGQVWPVSRSRVLVKSQPLTRMCHSRVGRAQWSNVCLWGATNNRIPHNACKLVPTSSAGPEPRQKERGVPPPMPKCQSPTWATIRVCMSQFCLLGTSILLCRPVPSLGAKTGPSVFHGSSVDGSRKAQRCYRTGTVAGWVHIHGGKPSILLPPSRLHCGWGCPEPTQGRSMVIKARSFGRE